MHVGGVLVFDGTVTREEVVRRLRDRIHLIPRYAMRLDEAPLGIAHPVWVADDGFDPDRHVQRSALPFLFSSLKITSTLAFASNP